MARANKNYDDEAILQALKDRFHFEPGMPQEQDIEVRYIAPTANTVGAAEVYVNMMFVVSEDEANAMLAQSFKE